MHRKVLQIRVQESGRAFFYLDWSRFLSPRVRLLTRGFHGNAPSNFRTSKNSAEMDKNVKNSVKNSFLAKFSRIGNFWEKVKFSFYFNIRI